jgi:murein DD-endopeptidase MepM/ murein hydrolase activator NlpD
MGRRLSKYIVRSAIAAFLIISIGFYLPRQLVTPVRGASSDDWNPSSFWYAPWGESGVHKGIDIFASQGKSVVAATSGIVVYSGDIRLGGNVLIVLGPHWQLHHYAHMDSVDVNFGNWVRAGRTIGAVGTTGNAAGKQPHLHYAIQTLWPYPGRFRTDTQGWKRMFYLNPAEELGKL